MNFTDLFIRRPVFAMVLSLIILLVGLKSYFALPVRLYPKVDATAVNVYVTYPGADASLMEGFVTTPIENAIAGVDGIDYMISQSTAGTSSITIYFTLGYDINVAVSDVNSKVSSVRSKLPNDINDPVVAKKDPNAQPSMYINYLGGSMPAEQISDYLERVIQPQLQTLPGVSQAQIYGSDYAMRIWLDPTLMTARNITTQDITSALITKNAQTPSGPIKSTLQQLNVKNNTDLTTEEQFNNLVIRESDGSLVRIKDVGRAELGAKTTDVSAFAANKTSIEPMVTIAITPGPTANPVDVSSEVKAIFPKFAKTMPKGLTSRIVWDNSIYIAQSIEEVQKTIVEATICVIFVVFLFLGAWRVLLIPVVTIPLSLIGVCTIMLMMGYTINTMTVLAMVLAIGMVVDDAIVVAENVHRHLSMGRTPFQAAIYGAREIQFAVIAMTFTLAAVYAPIGFLSGLTGSLFKEFAFTLAASVVISGFIALTLSPMMCSKFMNAEALNGGLARFIHHFFDEKIMSNYKKLLTKVITYRKTIISIIIATFALIIFLFKILPGELVPREDVGGVFISITAPTSANFKYTEKYTSYIQPILQHYPELDSSIIVNGTSGPNTAIGFMILKPWAERTRSAFDIVQDLRPKLWAITGLNAFPLVPSLVPGAGGGMPIQLIIQTTGDYEDLYKVMQKLLAAAKSNPKLMNVDTDLKLDQPEVDLHIDRNRAGDMGIDIKDLGNAVNIALGEPQTNQFSLMGRAYYVIPQLEPQYRNRPDSLNLLYMRTQSGDLVPLSNLVSLEETLQPQSLNHFQQLRSATLTAAPIPGYSMGQALSFLQGEASKAVPGDMKLDYGGESRQFVQEGSSLLATFAFAIIFIFLILAAQFESFRDPFVVLFSVPPSVFGALLILFFTMRTSIHSTVNIYSEIGVVTLIGLISKHGILMVEFANQLQEQGRTIKEAIIEAASIRLRPVLMTTGAMILGAVPLAVATGAGSISRSQIGLVIVGGMTIGTLFTLFVVPTMYTLIASKKVSAAEIDKKLESNVPVKEG